MMPKNKKENSIGNGYMELTTLCGLQGSGFNISTIKKKKL